MINLFTNTDLFGTINEYTDLRSLCDTCILFATLKKYINYKLNKKYSLMYYDNIAFRNIIISKLFNPCKQLHLNLSDCNNITDVNALGNVNTLDLSGCKNITDVSALGNVHTLDLSWSNIIDVSALGNVHTLNLSWCINIIDVSGLGNVHTLNLSGCINIIDVSALGNVYTLNLSGCKKIKDVSALGNVHLIKN